MATYTLIWVRQLPYEFYDLIVPPVINVIFDNALKEI